MATTSTPSALRPVQAYTIHTRLGFIIPQAFAKEPMSSGLANLCASSFKTQGRDAVVVSATNSPHVEVHFTVQGAVDEERLAHFARTVAEHVRAILPPVGA